jgi:hypothetical protein
MMTKWDPNHRDTFVKESERRKLRIVRNPTNPRDVDEGVDGREENEAKVCNNCVL